MLIDKGKPPRLLFGEFLLEYGVITREQLKKALDWQIHVGGRVGSILKEMGYLDDDSLLSFLSKQFHTSYVNLFEVVVPPATLNLLPFEKVKSFQAFPIKDNGESITLAMINPNDMHSIQEAEFAAGRGIESSVVPFYQMEKALQYFYDEGYGTRDFDGNQILENIVTIDSKAPNVYSLLKFIVEHKSNELHLTAGIPPSIKINQELKRLPIPNISSEQMIEFIQEVLTQEQKEILVRDREIDFALSLPHTGHFRINIYKQRGSLSLSARFVIENIPTLENLNLPDWIKDYALKHEGLILITGPSGHGKTTTLAAVVDFINTHRRCNIVSLEDPIEYLHKHKKSNINQREIGVDTGSFAKGLNHIFRQNADVIVIGDLKDPESISTALTAVERGRLVLSTMHAQDSITALEKIIKIFPEHQQHQITMQLADTFLLVLGQRLVPKKGTGDRILAYEKITNSLRVRNLIRERNINDIRTIMKSPTHDATSIDQSLAEHYLKSEITYEDGFKFSDNPSYFQELIKP
jgi:twitching motility protein PilT